MHIANGNTSDTDSCGNNEHPTLLPEDQAGSGKKKNTGNNSSKPHAIPVNKAAVLVSETVVLETSQSLAATLK